MRRRERDLATIEAAVPRIKQSHGLKICVSVGLLNPNDAHRLKACGVDMGTSGPVEANLRLFEKQVAELKAQNEFGISTTKSVDALCIITNSKEAFTFFPAQ